jgi:HD-GYP domain-containing protein (c-di-GMP phosphodiesterase class II)
MVGSVELVALLHDIGKVGTPDAILRKPTSLTADELAVMREHPAIGATIIQRIAALAHLGPAIRAEHEQWNGGGYPDKLSGDTIPIESRITLVCDAFHAMVSDRPYRRAMSQAEAIAELRRCSGTMFWPDAVAALTARLEQDGTPRGDVLLEGTSR